MRALLTLMIFLLTLSASGISSAIASSVSSVTDDCCADGETDTAPDRDAPEGRETRCPPLCHACACSPVFALPTFAPVSIALHGVDGPPAFAPCAAPPPSPPGQDVFHPPRRAG